MLNFFLKKNGLKLTAIFIVALMVTVFFWQYLNLYLTRSKADASSVTLSLIPATSSFGNQEVKEFKLIAQFNGGSAAEKIDYLKVKINFPKENLELADYVDTIDSSLGRQIRVDGPAAANGNGIIIIELGALSPGSGPATNSGPVTIAKIKFKGKSAIQNGAITINTAEIYNNFSVTIDQITKNNATFSVVIDGPTSTPVPTATTAPGEPTNTPVPTGGVGSVRLNVKLKFQGILNKRPTDALNKMLVKFTLYDETTSQSADYDIAGVASNEEGIWSGVSDLTVNTSHKFALLVKGPYHLQKKICRVAPTETAGGTYRCSKGNITLTAGDNNLDLSGIISLAGDLPEQDGTVSSYDISLVRNCIGKTDETCLSNADVNRDEKVDTQDYSLIIAALSVKNDEL